jgi:predicted ATPase
VLIRGEPGIGKTLLLRELSRSAHARGYRVVHGCATELERNVPFLPFVDALDGPLLNFRGQRLRRLGTARVAEPSRCYPALADLSGARRMGLPGEPYLLHDAIRRLIELLAEDQPVVLALDDMHWADEASAELLARLLRHPPQAPVTTAVVAQMLSQARARCSRISSVNRPG